VVAEAIPSSYYSSNRPHLAIYVSIITFCHGKYYFKFYYYIHTMFKIFIDEHQASNKPQCVCVYIRAIFLRLFCTILSLINLIFPLSIDMILGEYSFK
jgi:hypothetical protein